MAKTHQDPAKQNSMEGNHFKALYCNSNALEMVMGFSYVTCHMKETFQSVIIIIIKKSGSCSDNLGS